MNLGGHSQPIAVGLGQGLRFCISNKLPGGADGARAIQYSETYPWVWMWMTGTFNEVTFRKALLLRE